MGPEAFRIPFAGFGACKAPAEHESVVEDTWFEQPYPGGREPRSDHETAGRPCPTEDGSTTKGVGAPRARGSLVESRTIGATAGARWVARLTTVGRGREQTGHARGASLRCREVCASGRLGGAGRGTRMCRGSVDTAEPSLLLPEGFRGRQGQSWTGRDGARMGKALRVWSGEYLHGIRREDLRPTGSTRDAGPPRRAGRSRADAEGHFRVIFRGPRGDGASEVRPKEGVRKTTPQPAHGLAKAGVRREPSIAGSPLKRGGDGVSRDDRRSSLKTESWIAEFDRYGSGSSENAKRSRSNKRAAQLKGTR